MHYGSDAKHGLSPDRRAFRGFRAGIGMPLGFN